MSLGLGRRLIHLGWIGYAVLSATALANPPGEMERQRITMYATQDLDFGRVASRHQPGSTSLDTQSSTVLTTGLDRVGRREQLGNILLRGEPGAEFSIFVVPELIFDGPAPSALTGILQAAPRSTGRFNAAGRAEIHIGGLLRVPPGLVGGVYRAKFELRVEYR